MALPCPALVQGRHLELPLEKRRAWVIHRLVTEKLYDGSRGPNSAAAGELTKGISISVQVMLGTEDMGSTSVVGKKRL